VTRLAVDSKYWLWVNGKLVVFEGGLKRGPAPGEGYYDEIDLAPHLAPGPNTVAVLAWYWGKHGFAHQSSGKPGFVFEASLGGKTVKTDRTWKARAHPAYEPVGGEQPNRRLAEPNIRFDARNDIAGWMAPGYDDATWNAPVESGAPPSAPWGRLVRRPIPFWKDYGLKNYTNAAAIPAAGNGGVVTGKLPYNAQVTPYLQIDAPAGLTIDIRTDNYKGGSEPNVRAEYVTREGVQEYESLGWMNGHSVRYTIPAGVKILALKYRETGFDAESVGSFRCDDPFYNTLWEKARRTLYITMRDNYMDCPDRERAQWWGDVVNELGEIFYVFDPRAYTLTRKAILELMNWQRSDKTIYSPVPAGGRGIELPLQMLASVGRYGFWTYYFYSGDAETMRTVYPRVKDYLNIWKLDANGLVVHRAGGWDWGDWGKNIDMRLLDSAWYHLALQGAAEMAALVGRPEDIPEWQSRMEAIKKGFNATFWNGKEYRSPAYKKETDDRGNALAVVAGLAGPDKFEAIRAVLTHHHNASPYMEKYVLEALYLMNDATAGLERMKKRYREMVDSPYTTLWEGWGIGKEGFGGGTYNHAWSGGPLTILSQYAAGVAPDKPAYEAYHVLPRMGTLKTIRAVIPTIKGNIMLDLARDGETFAMKLVSPPKTTALVGIPKEGRSVVRVEANDKVVRAGGAAKEHVPGIAFKSEDARYILFTVAAGTVKIKAVYEAK